MKRAGIISKRNTAGTFVIQTNEEKYEDEKLTTIYKNLNKVENAFRIIKHDLDIRLMYHRKEERVKGYAYVCVIAYFLIAAIDYHGILLFPSGNLMSIK